MSGRWFLHSSQNLSCPIVGYKGSENSLHIQDEYNLFFGNEYTPFSEDIYIPEKGIYFSGKNIILFRQKVYTFLSKSIYFLGKKYILFFQKEIMLLYISDIQRL